MLIPISVLLPSNDLDDMLTIELKGVFSPVVDALLVGQEVGEDHHLGNDRPVLQDLLLNANLILSNAVVHQLVESIVEAALIGIQVLFGTLLNVALVRIALLGDKSSSLSPIESSVDVASFAAVASLIAVQQFLRGKLHWDLHLSLMANSIADHSQDTHDIGGAAVAGVLHFLDALGHRFLPVVLLREHHILLVLGFARRDVRSI